MSKLRLSRRALVPFVSAFALATLLAQSAFADPRDFELKNNSPVDLAFVFVSPTAANDWGDDLMGTDVLPQGQSVNISFKKFDGSSCSYDIKVVGSGGEEGYLYKVDLCTISNVSFS